MAIGQRFTSSDKLTLNNSLTIIHQNIRGLKDKIDELMHTLASNNMNPHIICLSEHYSQNKIY
jgi:hypothetical protein